MDILCDAMKDDALVISTLVNSQLSAVAREFSQKQGLSYLDLMHPFLKSFKKKQGLDQSKSQEHCIVWIAIILRRFQRSSLLSNMMMVRHRRVLDADLVLLGVSRTSKTPSVFSSQQGL